MPLVSSKVAMYDSRIIDIFYILFILGKTSSKFYLSPELDIYQTPTKIYSRICFWYFFHANYLLDKWLKETYAFFYLFCPSVFRFDNWFLIRFCFTPYYRKNSWLYMANATDYKSNSRIYPPPLKLTRNYFVWPTLNLFKKRRVCLMFLNNYLGRFVASVVNFFMT